MSKRQKEETAKYCVNLSQICVGTLVFNSFTQTNFILQLGFSLAGLLSAAAFFILAMWIFKELPYERR